jgi:FMN phosphatase YigB (HAD superfamily)
MTKFLTGPIAASKGSLIIQAIKYFKKKPQESKKAFQKRTQAQRKKTAEKKLRKERLEAAFDQLPSDIPEDRIDGYIENYMMNEYGDRISAKKAGLSKKARKALASDTKPKTKKKN